MLNRPSKISQEERLFYFGVGFRSENIAKDLKKQKERGEYERDVILEDALNTIVEGCYSIISDERKGEINLKDINEFGLYLKLLIGSWETLENTQESERIFIEKKAELKNVKGLLENIINKQKVSQGKVDKGIKFFESLAERCSEYLNTGSLI
jgi:hypothetical protein